MNTPLSPAADASRPAHGHHHDHSQNRPPKAFLIGCGLLILFALVGVSVAKFTGLGNFTGSSLVAAETRALSFADREDGGIQAFDPSTGVLVHEWAPGEGNFARTALRALTYTREIGRLGTEAPFELSRTSDGVLFIADPATGKQVILNAFSNANAREFDVLLPRTAIATGASQ